MADEDLDLDVKNSGKGTKLLLIILIVLVLLVGGVGGFLFLSSGDEKDNEDTAEGEAVEDGTPLATLYMPLGKPFTINFSDTSKARFLQVEITIMARKQPVLDIVKKHLPIIQDDVINIIGSKSYEELNNQEGKKRLADEILKSIQAVVEGEQTASSEAPGEESNEESTKEKINGPGVEAIYFTSFIMQ